MDAVQGVLVTLPQVKRAGTEWTVWPSGHALAARQFLQTCCELGVAFENFFGGIPVRPFLLAVDHGHTGPAKSFAADGNSITPSLSTALHVIEVMVQWIHNDGAARLSRGVLNVCPAVGSVKRVGVLAQPARPNIAPVAEVPVIRTRRLRTLI